jgi:hypothetical protein
MPATETTITTEPLKRAPGRSGHRHWQPAFILSVALGALSLWLCFPRLQAETLRLSVVASLDSAESTPNVPAAMLHPQAQMMAVLGQRQELATAYSMAARFQLVMARSSVSGPNWEMHIHQAEKFFEAALRRAPLSPENWQRLSYVRYTQEALQDAAVAWQLSVQTKPFDRQLLASRFEAGLALWPYMSLQARSVFSEQCAMYWAWEPDQFIDLVRYFGAKDTVDHAFAATVGARLVFDAKLAERQASPPSAPRLAPGSDIPLQKD